MRNTAKFFLFCFVLIFVLSLLPAPREVRGAPPSFTVNSAQDNDDADPGNGFCEDEFQKCTLRAAIEESNSLGIKHLIYFSLPSPTTIFLDSELPDLNYADIFGPNDRGITIDGQDEVGIGITFGAVASTTVSNLRIQRFTFAAIYTMNFTGTDQIMNNIIINNKMRGVYISGQQVVASTGSIIITGNYIGYDPLNTSTQIAPNGTHGIDVLINRGSTTESIVRIGGEVAEDRNLVSGNVNCGILINSEDIDAQTIIQGNYIGVDESGTIAAPNGAGVCVNSHPGPLTIGGDTAAAGNLIAGNRNEGISISKGVNFSIRYNNLSTNAVGTAFLPNGEPGGGLATNPDIKISRSDLLSINDNVAMQGIWILGSETYPVTEVTMLRNYVGVTRSGFARPASITRTGIRAEYMYNNSQIAFNRITGFRTGIHIDDGTFTNISSNRIFNISGLGIDIDPWNQINPNDDLDEDEGPNTMQNFPTLTVIKTEGTLNDTYDVTVNLHSTPNTLFRVEVFSSAVCFEGGYGEGEEIEKSSNAVLTDIEGNATWQVSTIYDWEIKGECFTATASKVISSGVYGSTSEFALITVFTYR